MELSILHTQISQSILNGTDYQMDFCKLRPDFVYAPIRLTLDQTTTKLYVTGVTWVVFAFSRPSHGRFLLWTPEGPFEATPGWALFLPPYSIIEWTASRGSFFIPAFGGAGPLPENAPNQATAFATAPCIEFHSPQDVFSALQGSPDRRSVERQFGSEGTMQLARKMIEASYRETLKIGDIARALRIPRRRLSEQFALAFGLSPSQYRTQLRLMDAVNLMLIAGLNSSQAAFSSGFMDLSRFNKQFKKHIEAVPSDLARHNRNFKRL